MTAHDVMSTEDGVVRCRCGRVFAGPDLGRARERHHRHQQFETVGREEIGKARAEIERRRKG